MKKNIFFLLFILSASCAFAQTNNAYGDNQKQVEPGVFAIYSGDINQDGVIDIFDQVQQDNDIFNFAGGYVPTDLNGDAVVDIFDQVILDNNINLFIGVISPLTMTGSNRTMPSSRSLSSSRLINIIK